ncbi:MAG: SHOCT domain-containing protein [Nocardiaceae bacterium]|nr:SHOCT domain-containing protein [Nocardiaceae bacterium]
MADSPIAKYARARYLVLAVFCASVFPNLIAAILVPPTSLTDGVPGWVFVLWIVGFIVELLLSIWLINSMLGATSLFVFAFGAVVPWCLSMAFGVWSVTAVIGIVVVGAFAFWAFRTVDARYRLEAFGIRCTATVVEVLTPTMNVVINNIYVRRTMRVEITRPDTGQRYEAEVSGLFEFGSVPSPGTQLGVIVDGQKPDRVTLDESRKAQRVFRGGSSSARPVVSELERLAKLHRSGDLSDDEYGAAKRRLLDGA